MTTSKPSNQSTTEKTTSQSTTPTASSEHTKSTTTHHTTTHHTTTHHTTTHHTAASGKVNDGKICARCSTTKCRLLSDSPVKNVWQVYQCETCLYTWRTTDTENFTNPDKYPEVFRVNPADLTHLFVMPSIPPLRKKS